jgi:nucleotide-binding universal stress UspA family protein
VGHVRIVVGCAPGARCEEALAFTAALARGASGSSVVAAAVHPAPWPAGTSGAVDAEWRAYLAAEADRTLAAARERLAALAPGVPVEVHRHEHASSGRGLAEVAEEFAADVVVLGPAAGAAPGRHAVGSTASRLLHGSAGVPVALVPAGWMGPAITAVTVAYQDTEDCAAAVRFGAAVAAQVSAPLHVVSLVERPPALFPGRDRSLAAARATAAESLKAAVALAPPGLDVRTEVGEGDDLADALGEVAWEPGELLVCGSGRGGVLRRVFLGDAAFRLLRAARVPVAVVPRSAT